MNSENNVLGKVEIHEDIVDKEKYLKKTIILEKNESKITSEAEKYLSLLKYDCPYL